MRYLLIILSIFLLSCEQVDNSEGMVHDHSGILLDRDLRICKAIAAEYAPHATIYIVPDQPLTYGILGLANQLAPHTYLIQINRLNDFEMETLFHEMGHVIDSEQGRLEFTGDMSWDGITCNFEIPWNQRPWEVSANEWRDCLRQEYESGVLKGYDYSLENWLKNYNINLIYFR